MRIERNFTVLTCRFCLDLIFLPSPSSHPRRALPRARGRLSREILDSIRKDFTMIYGSAASVWGGKGACDEPHSSASLRFDFLMEIYCHESRRWGAHSACSPFFLGRGKWKEKGCCSHSIISASQPTMSSSRRLEREKYEYRGEINKRCFNNVKASESLEAMNEEEKLEILMFFILVSMENFPSSFITPFEIH